MRLFQARPDHWIATAHIRQVRLYDRGQDYLVAVELTDRDVVDERFGFATKAEALHFIDLISLAIAAGG